MALTLLTKDNQSELLGQQKYIIKFYAEWCGPCKLLGPIVKEVATEVKVPIVEVNVDTEATKPVVEKYGVQSIPQMVYIVDGKEVARHNGFMTKDQLIAFINGH